MGTPALAINFSGKEEHSIYKKGNRLLECNTLEEFENKLLSFFADESFRIEAEESREKWLKENVFALDGKSSERAIEAIVKHITRRTV